MLHNLGPKEEARLHAEINDRRTEKSPSDRAKIVTDTLAQFLSHRRWEQTHPGQFWEDRPVSDRGGHD
jgi:predicted NAD/FAD-binding protein